MTQPFQPNLFRSKFPNTTDSIFSQMTQLANQFQAINLSQGFPDFDVDPKLISLVTKNMQNGLNQYAPMPGVFELRQSVASKYSAVYGLDVDAKDEITITAGGTQALYTAIGTLIERDDEVIIFEPAYDSYRPSVEAYGGIVVPIQLLAPDFTIDWELVRSKISAHTRLIIINNPNNPTGKLLTASDIEALEALVQEFGIYVLSDEVYEHLVYDDKQHHTVWGSAILRNNSMVAASFGKVLHTTGWKLGYLIANPILTTEFRKLHQFNVFSVNTPVQYAVAEYLEDLTYYDSLKKLFVEKRDFLQEGLRESGFKILPCEGTYFMLLDYSSLSDMNEKAYASHLIKEFKVATIPVSAFYSGELNQHLLRVCFAKKPETLSFSIENLLKV